ncbi:MAG: flavin-dependent monooxygenase [Novosphingobium sp.]|nr:flavin-dependent monooxygenase [Novosphingobium sp.]
MTLPLEKSKSRISAEPTPHDLRARAQAIATTLPGRIADANARRDLDPAVIAELREADLFRLFRPRRFGGYEADPRLFYDIQNTLAEQCLSTAWVFGVLSIQSFVLAQFDSAAQDDVWGSDADALVSSSFKPEGSVVPVEGGYRISGQWAFSSGSSHAGWALIGGLVPPGGQNDAPEMRLFLVPRSDYRIVDTWRTFGLRGTGSNDLRIEEAFVPTHRTWKPTQNLTTSALPDTSPLFRLPWMFMFPSCIANLAIGAGRGAIRKLAQALAAGPAPAPDAARAMLARAAHEVEAANVLLQNNIGCLWDHTRAGTVAPLPQAIVFRAQLAAMLRDIAARVDELMLLTGGRGISESGPLTQTWLDLCAARHHMGNIPEPAALTLADTLCAGPQG